MRRRLFTFLILSLLAFPVAAAITGTVMNYEGQPLAGARVSIHPVETFEARRVRLLSAEPQRVPRASVQTDSKGAFSLDSPKDMVVELTVEKSGYAPETMRVEREEEVGAVALLAAETKRGTITAGGKPLAGARVVWFEGGAEALAITDNDGKYAVPDPAKWASSVVVIHPDYAVLEDQGGMLRDRARRTLDRTLDRGVKLTGRVVGEDGRTPVAKASVFVNGWPAATTVDDGTFAVAHAPQRWRSIEARSGALYGHRAETGGAITVRLARPALVMGIVRDAKTQAPLAGTEVSLRTASRFDFLPAGSAVTDAKGAFTISGFPAGKYELWGSRTGYVVPSMTISVADGQKISKQIPASALARVAGSILDEEKRPVAGAVVTSEEAEGDNFMRAIRRMQSAERRTAFSAPDGRFVIRIPAEEERLIAANKRGFPNAKSQPLRLAHGETKRGVTITIPRGVAVSGRVVDRDGNPLSGVSVTAMEAEPGGARMSSVIRRTFVLEREREGDVVRSARDGAFSLRLKEGEYDLTFRGEGFAQKTVRGQRVTSTTPPVEVTLDPGVEITGRVSRNGVGVPDVSISSFARDTMASTTTGPDGSFRLEDLTPGPMMVTVSKADDFINVQRTVTAPARDVNIELPPGGRVSGRVVDKATGRAVTSFQAGISTSRGGGGISFAGPPQLRAFTTDDGTFTLDNVPAGPVQLVVTAPGYTTARLSNLTLDEGKAITDVEVALDTGVRVTGKVTGSDGRAISGATVRLNTMLPGRAMRMSFGDDQSTFTDTDGEYVLEAVEPGEKTFEFSHGNYVPEERTVELSGREAKVDVQLSSGSRVAGVVTTESGVPVGDAQIRASSANAGGFGRTARSDAGGAFSLEGLAPGRYTFTASKVGFADGVVRDVDVTAGAPVRITLKTGGVVYGHVSGLSESELSAVTVEVRGPGAGLGASGAVDAAGNYRIEGAPTGTIRVSAEMSRGFGDRRTTPMVSKQLEPGSSVQVDLEFQSSTAVRGRVTRNGRPLSNGLVWFMPRNSPGQTSAQVTTDDGGNYTVTGLADGMYSVRVTDMQRFAPYTTTYEVRGGGTFDIDVKTVTVRGRVMDEGTGEPLGDARVQLRSRDVSEAMFGARTVVTDTSGGFTLDSVPPGTYNIVADKEGYGNDVDDLTVRESGADEIELRIARNDGVTLRVVDARDGRLLSAMAIVTDAQDRVVRDEGFRFGGTPQPLRLSLAPGQYRATISALDYATRTVLLTSPSTETVHLTPGGTLVIRSKSSTPRRARLIDASGRPYMRSGSRNVHFTIDASPGATTISNVAPGQYTLQVLGSDEQVEDTQQVTIVEGQVVQVDV